MKKRDIVVGLEIGRNRVNMTAVDIYENEERNGDVNLLFASKTSCADGVRNGSVINLDSVTEAISKLLEESKQKTQKTFSSAYVNISGINIQQEVINSVITLPQRGCEINEKHIKDLMDSCKIISIPMDSYLLYLLPLEYIIDGQSGIKDPLGLCGTRLEARIMIITAPFNQIQNIIKAVNFAGLEVDEVVLNPFANACSMLDEEEKKKGVLLIDLKTDFTEIAVMCNESLLFFKAIAKGQGDITAEIASRLNIPFEYAEELKTRYGFLDAAQADPRNQDVIPVEWMGKRINVARGDVNKIIAERLGLIFDVINEEIKGFKGFHNSVRAGAVVSGGAIYMDGFIEWITNNLGFNARPAVLKSSFSKLDHSYGTSLGLLRFGLLKKGGAKTKGESRLFKRVFQKTGEILGDYF